jgi:PadR family transcriptional regulator, regulatory protein AphA
MSRASGLTSTSYVVLGLLCVRPWTAYELVQQMERGWSDVWPRAGRGIYNEPKKLVAHGHATGRAEPTGNRNRNVYAATEQGRDVFAHWLGEASAPPAFESEALVRVLFADHGSIVELRAAINALRDHAQSRSRALLEQGTEYQTSGGPHPERVHLLHLVGGFLAEQHAATLRWADWAEAHIDTWETTLDAAAVPGLDELARQVAARMANNLDTPTVS